MSIAEPLLDAPGREDGFSLVLDELGCVELRYPAWHLGAGSHSFRLSPKELAALRSALAATRIDRYRAGALAAALAERNPPPGGRRVYVSDLAMIDLTLSPPGADGRFRLRFRGMDELRANHPQQADLADLERAVQLLRGLETHPEMLRRLSGRQ
jgi:hypothetical protein